MNTFASEHNDLVSSITSAYNIAERGASGQSSLLASHGTTKFDFGLASSKGGFKPHISAESELIKRTRSAGFGQYLMPLSQPDASEYTDALDKGEQLMVSHKPVTFNKARLMRSGASVFRYFTKMLPSKLSTVSLSTASESLNLSASAGYPYYSKKALVVGRLIDDCRVTPFSVWRYYPTMRSFRVQLRLQDNHPVHKVRVIYPYPGMITLHEMRFVQPLVEYFKSTHSSYIIGRSGAYVSQRIKHGARYPYSFSSDISAFDQNMPNEIVFTAFAVIRQFFRLDREDAELFEQLSAYFTSSSLVSRVGPRGSKSLVKLSGIPSGTGFTNIIGTICHAIVLAYYDLKWFDETDTLLCSDDNLCFTTRCFDFKSLSKIYNPWGLTLKADATDFYSRIDKVHFLGFDWLRGVRVINPQLALNQLCYHTQFIVDLSFYDRIVARAASVLLNGANGASYFNAILPDIDQILRKDRTFLFIPNYRLPTSPSIISSERVSRTRESLDLHLKYGWQIR